MHSVVETLNAEEKSSSMDQYCRIARKQCTKISMLPIQKSCTNQMHNHKKQWYQLLCAKLHSANRAIYTDASSKLLNWTKASSQKGKLWEKWLLRKPQDIGLTQLPIFLRWQVTQLRFVCLFRQVLHLTFKLQIFPNRTKPHATDDVMQYSSRKTCKCCNASNSKIQKLFSENTDQVTWEENDCWRKQNISLTQLPTFLQSI